MENSKPKIQSRIELKPYVETVVRCSGRFEDVRFITPKTPILLFRDVTVAGYEYDHMWIGYRCELADIDIAPNDFLEFDGTVIECSEGRYAVNYCKNFKTIEKGLWTRDRIPVKVRNVCYGRKYKENVLHNVKPEVNAYTLCNQECNLNKSKNFLIRLSKDRTKENIKKGMMKIEYNLFDENGKYNDSVFSVSFIPPLQKVLVNRKFDFDIKASVYRKLCLDYFKWIVKIDKNFFYQFDDVRNFEGKELIQNAM